MKDCEKQQLLEVMNKFLFLRTFYLNCGSIFVAEYTVKDKVNQKINKKQTNQQTRNIGDMQINTWMSK